MSQKKIHRLNYEETMDENRGNMLEASVIQ